MTVTGPIRTTTKRRLHEVLLAGLPGVEVHYAEPPQWAPLCIWLGGSTPGTTRPAGMKSGRKPRFDDFRIEVHGLVYLTDTDDFSATDELAEGLWAQVDSVLAESPTLTGHPGLLWATAADWTLSSGFLELDEHQSAISSEVIGYVNCSSHLH